MSTTIQTYDATNEEFVDAAVVREVVATEILHIASKMPYAHYEDARRSWDYLTDRFTFWGFINATGIRGPEELLDRAINVRAAAENAVTA